MWARLFGPSTYTSDLMVLKEEEEEKVEVEEQQVVYLIDGANRLPIPLASEEVCKDVRTMRQWVFETLARLPLEENVEEYTFKVLPDGYIYWYPFSYQQEEAYGILMKYNPEKRCFTGLIQKSSQSEQLPQIPLPKGRPKLQGIVEVDISDKSNNTFNPPCSPTTNAKPKRNQKRTRK